MLVVPEVGVLELLAEGEPAQQIGDVFGVGVFPPEELEQPIDRFDEDRVVLDERLQKPDHVLAIFQPRVRFDVDLTHPGAPRFDILRLLPM